MDTRVAAQPGAEPLILIGASTGGTEAIRDLLAAMPEDAPAIVIAQHMPEGFTRSFAARLDALCPLSVKEAGHGERVLRGHAYIAPGHSHLKVLRSGTGYVTRLSRTAPVNRHRPSVDVLFHSAAVCGGGERIAGVILTGMGKDGAQGLLALRRAGAHTYAQDEGSCVVFGMPKEAIAVGAAAEVLDLHAIPRTLLERLRAAA
jgi:two-component system chemotaxis response regulator CheB